MGSSSKIEWTEATWSPIRARNLKTGKVGWHCEHATTGCELCYAEGMNKRLGTGLPFKPGHRKDIEIFLDEEMLTAPLRWRRPRRIFVNSMSDTFADFVKDEWIDRMFAVMALSGNHTFQVLTKRASRMRDYAGLWFERLATTNPWINHPAGRERFSGLVDWMILPKVLPNVWMGVSAERQPEADERIGDLLETAAAVRFVSLEPLLGPIELKNLGGEGSAKSFGAHGWSAIWRDNVIGRPWLDWVIVGGESGPKARPMNPDWARRIRDDCDAAGVPYFFKQFGEFSPEGLRVGKKAAGRLLDGVEHNGMPSQAAKHFFATIDDPPEPTADLVELFRQYGTKGPR